MVETPAEANSVVLAGRKESPHFYGDGIEEIGGTDGQERSA